MKVKQSFVTNSSSTSFVLTTNAECCFKCQDTNRIVDNFSQEFPLFNNVKSYKNYGLTASCQLPLDDRSMLMTEDEVNEYLKNNHDELDEYNSAEIKLNLDFAGDSVYVSLTIDNPSSVAKRDPSNKLATMIILKNLKRLCGTKLKVRCFYHQYISSTYGDGWNGGDPMGVYKIVQEAKKNETIIKNYYI